jgi:hypothetical protein
VNEKAKKSFITLESHCWSPNNIASPGSTFIIIDWLSCVVAKLNVSASLCVGAHFQHPIWARFFHAAVALSAQLQCDEKLHKKVKET